MRKLVVILLLWAAVVAVLLGPGCLSANNGSASGGGGGSGGGGVGGSVAIGGASPTTTSSGTTQTSTLCGGEPCTDPCANVKCPTGQFCAYNGMCEPKPTCAQGGDCTLCTDFTSCAACNEILYPAGWTLFNALRSCVSCQACYQTCGGATLQGWGSGHYCASPPVGGSSCDTNNCGDCGTCATNPGGACARVLEACSANTQCNSLLGSIPECPAPMGTGGGGAGGGTGAGGAPPDAGGPDAGHDAGHGHDAGTTDAATTDAGSVDAAADDAGPEDAGAG
jgi:hypothetical protein